MITINLNNNQINLFGILLNSLTKYAEWKPSDLEYFVRDAGNEHYRLIAYIGAHFPDNSHFVDIGTSSGLSALALSLYDNHRVTTYDIWDCIPNDKITIKNRENVTCKIGNCLYDIENLLKAVFIVLDVDPHDGIQEREIMHQLELHDYRGIVFLDDIHLNDEMQQFYQDIKYTKYDLTSYGHFSGSSIVIFDKSRFNIVLE